MYPPKGDTNMGNFIAWDGKTGKIVWSNKEQFSAWGNGNGRQRGVLRHARGLSEGGRRQEGKELYKFKTPSGIIGNVMTYEHGGKQYVAVLSASAVGPASVWAAGLLQPETRPPGMALVDQGKLPTEDKTVDTAGLGAVGVDGGVGVLHLALGGTLTVSPCRTNRCGDTVMTSMVFGALLFAVRPFCWPPNSENARGQLRDYQSLEIRARYPGERRCRHHCTG